MRSWRPRRPISSACWPNARTRFLATSGRAVGLPDGQMGNSEVGHTNIGAGRLVLQDLPRIDDAVADGSLAKRPGPAGFDRGGQKSARKRMRGAVHLMGLLSPGGVHSHQDHLAALARALADAGLTVHIHAFLDGRDTPPNSARGFLEKFSAAIAGLRGVRIATVSGRYYAMDRDKRWDRVAKAYLAIVDAKGPASPMPRPPSSSPMRRASTTNSCCPVPSAIIAASPTAMRCCLPIFGPTGRGRFRRRYSIPRSTAFPAAGCRISRPPPG